MSKFCSFYPQSPVCSYITDKYIQGFVLASQLLQYSVQTESEPTINNQLQTAIFMSLLWNQQAAMNVWFRILINFSQAQQECFSFRTNKLTISKKLYTPTRSQNLTHHNLHGL